MADNLQQTILGRYQQLVKVQQELSAILNIEQLLQQISKSALVICRAELAMLFLFDQANQCLQFKAGTLADTETYRKRDISITSSLEGWVLTNKKPVVINDSSEYNSSYGLAFNPENLEIKSSLCLPLIVKDTAIGVLELVNHPDQHFTPVDQEILTAFSNQVATYIINTQLFIQSDLVSELVHELRTPLVSLNMAVNLLQRPDLAEEKRSRVFELISKEFNRLADMTTSFLEYARLESGRTNFLPSRFEIQQLMEESVDVMEFQAVARGISISIQDATEHIYLSADRDKVKQVILNLLNNAIKYNHPGGKVSISAQRTPTDLVINVHDDGQGIPAEYMPRLFTRFFRAPNQETQTIGTGLGLSICKQIVEAHHGRLEVTSEVNEGSTFTVRLPIIQEDEFIPVE